MRDAVAVSAFGELGQHCCWVRSAVTGLALGHHLVFCLMAGCTAQFLVLEFAGRKLVVSFLVAAGAILGRCFVVVCDVFRHVSLVTLLAVGSGLLGIMGLMALGTYRNFAVSVVAHAAGERRMSALVIAKFFKLAGMAGPAGFGNVGTKYNVAGCVRVRVAAVAGGQFVMRFSFVTLAAERDDFPGCGWVTVVTVLAADLRLVLAACRGDVGRGFAVAFDAVIVE